MLTLLLALGTTTQPVTPPADSPSPVPMTQAPPPPPMTDDGAPQAFPAATISSKGDGILDAWDLDGDGKADVYDTTGDGKPDAADRNGDGTPDTPVRLKDDADDTPLDQPNQPTPPDGTPPGD